MPSSSQGGTYKLTQRNLDCALKKKKKKGKEGTPTEAGINRNASGLQAFWGESSGISSSSTASQNRAPERYSEGHCSQRAAPLALGSTSRHTHRSVQRQLWGPVLRFLHVSRSPGSNTSQGSALRSRRPSSHLSDAASRNPPELDPVRVTPRLIAEGCLPARTERDSSAPSFTDFQ